jgi:nicotinate-nucleotide adenylyltransferase
MVGQEIGLGVYVGSFDPVHSGHLAFALQAIQETSMEEVYFLPERMPQHKKPAEHYGHRVAMLKQALVPHQNLELMETVDKRFTATGTIPRLQAIFRATKLTFLVSAETFVAFGDVTNHDLLRSHKFVISVRDKQEIRAVANTLAHIGMSNSQVTLLDSMRPEVATEYVQQALRTNTSAPGVLPSVARYVRAEWLYATIPKT